MTCLALFDISHDAGFARMRAADDFAFRAVLQFFIVMGFHQDLPNRPHCTPKVQQLSCSLAAARLGIGLNKSRLEMVGKLGERLFSFHYFYLYCGCSLFDEVQLLSYSS
jgi:hypothetical protein